MTLLLPYRRFLTVSDNYDENRFFTEVNGLRMATPLLLALAVIEISDVVFAVDSIPAVTPIPSCALPSDRLQCVHAFYVIPHSILVHN